MRGGHVFIVVRSKTYISAQGVVPNPSTGLTTYVVNNKIYKRYFHDEYSISSFLFRAGFQIKQIKMYEENLSDDFERKNILSTNRPLIEVVAQK